MASSSYIVSTSTAVSGAASRTRRVAPTPSSTGIRMSTSSTSGREQLDLADRALAVLGLPHDLDAVDGRQQGSQATADDRVVVGDHDSDRHAPMMAARLPSAPGKFFPDRT